MSRPLQEAARKPDLKPAVPVGMHPDLGRDKPEVAILFSTGEVSVPAFKQAVALAKEIDASLRLIVLQKVPAPLEPDTTPASAELMIRRLWTEVPTYGVQSRVQIYRCRNREQALGMILSGTSIVVAGWGRAVEPVAGEVWTPGAPGSRRMREA
jgi:hypothetical protein